ncbi:tetratricopeptide (TPR) repeat protein [Enterococcus sp. PF1-24]|uniref:tetratricopeptide repeat protein n=1 Tax=unclassified Enterococcus TaxID=2608891 RepID=UPI002473920E|nr:MULTISPECIES: tetratricopeptide repeat protein [unclassified Enterococcus]MDH6365631.1 tetratricopeptide (TPR) repeat protein [Enterococcus sp. PFB1-1]MDH6402722.1 tetratricopeptide (TPR) repeat protein [Enterococcus sp. PF1-24]
MSYSEEMLQAISNEDLAQAQLMLQKALREDDAEILEALAAELMNMGFLVEAETVLQQLTTQAPEKQYLNISLAEIAIENNELDLAFEYLEKVSETDESYSESLLVMADLYQVLDLPEVSLAKLQAAQKLLPDEPVIIYALGELYFSNNQFAEAIECYQQLLTSKADVVSEDTLHERIGSALTMLGEFEEGLPYLEAAVEAEVSDDRLFHIAFTYLQLKDNQKAIHYLQELRLMNPEYSALYLYLAEALQEEELIEEAQEVAEEGIKENPFQVELYHLAAENAFRLHDMAASEKYLLKALELGEKQDETRLTLSNLYLNEERYEEVITTLEALEESGNPYAEWNLAQAYNQLEEFELATVHYDEAYQELKHEPEFLKEYGIFLREEGRLGEAQALLEHYLQHEPGDLEIASLLESFESRD